MPSSIAPMITSKSECSPRLWPSVRGRPRSLAQRPLPSMTRATWRGRSSGGMAGGRAPPAWGSGGRTGPLTMAPRRVSGMLHVSKRADRSAPGATAGTRRPDRCTLLGAVVPPRRHAPSRRAAARSSGRSCGTDGVAAPGGRQDRQVRPPAAIAKARDPPPAPPRRRRPGRPPRTRRTRPGRARSRPPPATGAGRRRAPAAGRVPRSPSARSPPTSSRNWRSAGSFSTGVNRSAVSSIAVPLV